ncbi:MAG: hypothetical protein JWM58_3347 [Rhizobium sp.]|nr:hypothetical protein [Rhizobium sp.]
MVRKRIVAVVGLTLAILLPQAVRAAETQCDFQPDIIALSDYVLQNRAGLPKFKGLRYGAISAYLKLKYARLADKDAEAMMMPLVQARVSRADELLLSWAINTYGVDAAIAIIGPKSANLLFNLGYSASVLRAAVVKEGIPALAEQWQGLSPEQRFRVETRVPTALLDKFDTYKSEMGRQAETQGMLQIAAGLAATQSDPKAWGDFAARVKDKEMLRRTLSYWRWTPSLVGNARLEDDPVEPEVQASRDRLHRVMIASAMIPERNFLTTYVNHSGKLDEGARVADTIITLATDKTGEPWTMDRAWIAAYLELMAVADDPAQADATLAIIPFGGIRHYDGSIRDVLDWIIAVDALKPFMSGKSEVKEKPGLISKDFNDWGTWQAVAGAIRNNSDLAAYQAAPQSRAITAELLFAAGRQHALAAFISSARPDDMSVSLAEDFVNRMDRTCYGYLNFPAEAIAFPDTPLFRFD